MMPTMIPIRTAILIHGYHLLADGWEEVIWGDPQHGIYGRAAAGLREALRHDAEIIFFTTGASQKDGLLEGEAVLNIARTRMLEMPEFSGWSENDAHAWLDSKAALELTSQVTTDELTTCADIALSRGVERLVLVSSPSHIMRAHQSAISGFSKQEKYKPLLNALYAVASDTCYPGTTVEDVVIIEPPHRPDRPKIFFNKTISGIFKIKDSETAQALDSALAEVIEEYKEKR